MIKQTLSPALKDSNKTVFCLIALIISIFCISCKESSFKQIGPPVTSVNYNDSDMKPIENIFMHNIAKGKLGTVSSGVNILTIDTKSTPEPFIFKLPIPPVEFSVPGFFAELRLNRLRFRDVKTHWDGDRKGLRLRFRFYNKRHGAIGYYKIGFVQNDISLKVKDVMLDLYLIPGVKSGKIVFEPLESELSFYEGKIPIFIRPIFRKQISKIMEESRKLFQPQFNKEVSRINQIISNLFVSNAQFVDIKVNDGSATLTVKYN